MKALVPVAVSLLSLTACTSSETPTVKPSVEPAPLRVCQLTDQNGVDDAGVNASAAAGLASAAKGGGVKLVLVESPTAADVASGMESLLAQGCQLVVGTGAATKDALQSAAAQNDALRVVLVGAGFTGADGAPSRPVNGQSVQLAAGQGGYLAGYLAAGASTSGKVAVVGGTPEPGTKVVMDGFADGVAAYNAANATTVTLLGWDKASQQGAFAGSSTDATRGRSAAKALIDQGADVVLGVGGPMQYGVAQAVQASESARLIWTGADAAQLDGVGDRSLASIVLDVSTPVAAQVKKVQEAEFDDEPYLGTVKDEAVQLVLDADQSASLPGQLRTQLDELTTKIADGSVTVESANAPQAPG